MKVTRKKNNHGIRDSVFAFMLLIVSTGLAGANAEGVSDWLMRMNDAANDRSYRGVFVLRNGDQIESMRIFHDARPEGVRERIFSLNGEPREIIRNQKEVWCYLPDSNKGVHQLSATDTERRFPALLPTKISVLEKNYELQVGIEDRIADRPARRIDVKPRDDFRFGYMLWIDTETGLILKADIIGQNGSSLEQYQFIEIEYVQKIPDQDMKPHTPDENLEWHSPIPSDSLKSLSVGDASRANWSPEKLPSGFKQTSYSREAVPGTDSASKHHMVFSDGLVSVSLYVEPVVDSDKLEGSYSMGAMSAFGVVVDQMQITAMGEVPIPTLTNLATSTARKDTD